MKTFKVRLEIKGKFVDIGELLCDGANRARFVYGSDLQGIRLAPAYDIISTTVYGQSSRSLSIAFGNESRINKVTTDDILQAAADAGMGKTMAGAILVTMQNNFLEALNESVLELTDRGFAHVKQLSEQILATGGISLLNS